MYMCQRSKFCFYTNLFIIGIIFSAWGDGISLGLQTLFIAILTMHYNGDKVKAIAFLSAYRSYLKN